MVVDSDYLLSLRERELEPLKKRIRQLEKQCAVLAAEVDRMRPLVDVVRPWRRTFEIYMLDTIVAALDTYEASKPK